MKHPHYNLLKAYLEDTSQPIYYCCQQTGNWTKLTLNGDLIPLFAGSWQPSVESIIHVGENPPPMLIVNNTLVKAGISMEEFSSLLRQTKLYCINSLSEGSPICKEKDWITFPEVGLGLVFLTLEDAQAMLDALLKPLKTDSA